MRFAHWFESGEPEVAGLFEGHEANKIEHDHSRIVLFVSGLCLSGLVTRPQTTCGHPALIVYNLLGELPAFILAWLDILVYLTLASACR